MLSKVPVKSMMKRKSLSIQTTKMLSVTLEAKILGPVTIGNLRSILQNIKEMKPRLLRLTR